MALTTQAETSCSVYGRTTEDLAKLVIETRYEDLPSEVRAAAKRLILDEIVVTAATFNTPMAEALIRLKADRAGSPEATLIVDGRKVPAASAGYVHGQLSNLLDADETMHNRMHTVSSSVMAALAMAEATGASGTELIAAVATGYEITARIGKSLRQWVPDGNGGMVFAPLFGYSWMSLGAAASAGRLLGLTVPQLASALGQAFVTTPVYFDILKSSDRWHTDGRRAAWHKYQMAGPCTAAGIEAALLTSYGWVAQDDLFDDGSGFWQSFAAPGCDFDEIYDGLGTRWHLTETSIKPYPFCRFGHAALDILSGIVAEHALGADDIEHMVVRIPPHQLCQRLMETVDATEPLALMFSQPTAMALIALGIPAGPKWFEVDLMSDDVRSVARRIGYEVVPEWGEALLEQSSGDGFFARLPTEVIVRTRSGEEHRGFAEYAKGDPWSEESAYSYSDVAGKARRFLDGILPPERIEALIEAVDGLEAAADVSAVASSFVR